MDMYHVAVFLVSFALGMAVGMALFTGAIGAISLHLTNSGGRIPPAHVLSRYVSYISMALGSILFVWSASRLMFNY